MERFRLIVPRVLMSLAACALLASAALQTACNTVEGAGEDVQAVGEGVSEASRDVRD
mgnify:CR=1 FL=1|jgi:predicted small secreted protein